LASAFAIAKLTSSFENGEVTISAVDSFDAKKTCFLPHFSAFEASFYPGPAIYRADNNVDDKKQTRKEEPE